MRYPNLVIRPKLIKNNAGIIKKICGNAGISIAGVIKGCDGDMEIIASMIKGGINTISSSRIRHLENVKKIFPKVETMMIRSSAKSEINTVISCCDYSVVTEIELVKLLDNAAMRQGKVHKIILMADIGDLREGYWSVTELIRDARYIEDNLKNVFIVGIGTNLGCYGSIKTTKEKMDELVDIAEKVESALGRRLDIISGGGTLAMPLVLNDSMPKRINHLRIGEAILLGRDLMEENSLLLEKISQDTFNLEMEVIEIKEKPTYPIGELMTDCFGQTNKYEDRGIKTRILLSGGRLDYGIDNMLIPKDNKVKVIGSSSDHTIIEVEGENTLQIGDVVEFYLSYVNMVYAMSSLDVYMLYD